MLQSLVLDAKTGFDLPHWHSSIVF